MVGTKVQYKEEQRKKVLEGALECFTSKGYEVAKIDDIVHISGISKGTIYKLFKSKEEIYISLMEQITNEVFEEMNAMISANRTAMEKLNTLFDGYLDKELQPRTLKCFLLLSEFGLYSSRKEKLLELLEEKRRIKNTVIMNILSEGIENEEFKPHIDVAVYAEMFCSFADGAMTHKLLYPDYRYQELINSQKDTFIKKIGK